MNIEITPTQTFYRNEDDTHLSVPKKKVLIEK